MSVTLKEVYATAIGLSPNERQEFMLQLREFACDYVDMEAGDWLRKYSISKPFKGDPKTQAMLDLKASGKL
jgi:hypothetical protein